MENNQSSEIVSNNETQNKTTENENSENILQTHPVSVVNPESNNSFALKKWITICSAGVLALALFLILAKETDICLAITCNNYSDSVTNDSAFSSSIGTDVVAYAGGAASLLVLTALLEVPVLPAVVLSTGIWILIQMLH